jgi:hypothetical protein
VALSDDQRKLLKLLAKQDEAYEAIAAATGANVEDLKAKAAGAIAELERDDGARDQGGRAAGQVDEGGRPAGQVDEGMRPAGPVAAGDPPPPAVAEASSGEVPPAAPPAGDAPRPARVRRAGATTPVRLPGNRRFAELLGGMLAVVLLILFATGTIDIGGGDDDEGGGGNAPALGGELPASGGKRATQAVLTAVDGGDASGRALFGRFKRQVVLVLAAEGLAPTSQGRSYAVSLVNPDGERIPIAATRAGESGAIATQIQLPATVLGALASGFDEMEVSLVVNNELESALKQARGEESVPDFGGEPVLRGEVTGPVVVGEESEG